MIVYVESNFVLEMALDQEEAEAASAVIDLGSQGSVDLCIPAFSLIEPFWALAGQHRRRQESLTLLQREGLALARSQQWADLQRSIGRVVGEMRTVEYATQSALEQTIHRLLAVATVLPLNEPVIGAAMRVNVQTDLTMLDAVVLGTIGEHLTHYAPGTARCFISKDRKDFGDPLITEYLRDRGCDYVPTIEHGLGWIRARLQQR